MRTQHTESLPLGWRIVRLGDVAEHCLGKMLDAKKNKGTPFPYLRNPNVRWFKIDLSDLQEMPFEEHELDRYGLLDGDVVVCEGGEAGRAAIWSSIIPNVKFQKAIHRVRVGPELLNRYLVYKLMADHQSGRLMDYFTGATIKHLTGQDLDRYEFPLPPLPEQRRIADVLDRAEALRAKRRAALAELDGLAQSIFIEMFGPPTKIMSNWPTQSLGRFLKFLTSGSRGWAEYYSEMGDLFLRIQNVKRDELSLTEVAYVKPPDTAEANRTKVNSGDVLLSITADIGRTAVVPDTIEKAFISQHLALLRTGGISPRFLSAYLSSESGQEQIFKRNKQGVKAGLNFDDIRSFIVPLPPDTLQQEFVRRVAVVEKLKAVQRASLAELDALFASLQDRAFRGAL